MRLYHFHVFVFFLTLILLVSSCGQQRYAHRQKIPVQTKMTHEVKRESPVSCPTISRETDLKITQAPLSSNLLPLFDTVNKAEPASVSKIRREKKEEKRVHETKQPSNALASDYEGPGTWASALIMLVGLIVMVLPILSGFGVIGLTMSTQLSFVVFLIGLIIVLIGAYAFVRAVMNNLAKRARASGNSHKPGRYTLIGILLIVGSILLSPLLTIFTFPIFLTGLAYILFAIQLSRSGKEEIPKDF